MNTGGLRLACCLMVALLPAPASARPSPASRPATRLAPDLPLSRERIPKLSSGELYALAEFYLRRMRKVRGDLERAAATSKAHQAHCLEQHLAQIRHRVARCERWRKKMWSAIRLLDRQRAVRLFTSLAHAYQRVLAEGHAREFCRDNIHIPLGPDDQMTSGCILPADPDIPQRVPRMPVAHDDTLLAHGPGFGFRPSRKGLLNMRLHLGGAMEQGFDSNPLLCDDHRGCDGAGYSRFAAHLDLQGPPQDADHNDPQRKLTLRLQGSVAHRQYFASAAASGARPSQTEAEVDLHLEYQLLDTLSVALSDGFARSYLRWRGEPAPREVNRAGLYLMWIPGGEAVELTGSYTFGLELLTGPGGDSADRFYHEAAFTGRWWFFARTAAVLDAAIQVRDLGDEPAPGSKLVFSHSTPLRLLAGLEGLITSRLHLTALAGYGNSFSAAGDSFSGALARVEASYIFGTLRNPAPVTRLYGGYERGFSDNYFSSIEALHEARVGFERFPWTGLQVHALVRFRHLAHHGFADGVTLSELQSYSLLASLTVGYKVDGWLYLAAGYQLEHRDTITDEAGAAAFAGYVGQYQRHQVYGRLGCSY